MKLTNKQLRQIIKEELEKVIKESQAVYIVRFTDRGVEVNDETGPVMMVTKGQYETYSPLEGAQHGDPEAIQQLLAQLSAKVGHQVSEKNISIQKEHGY